MRASVAVRRVFALIILLSLALWLPGASAEEAPEGTEEASTEQAEHEADGAEEQGAGDAAVPAAPASSDALFDAIMRGNAEPEQAADTGEPAEDHGGRAPSDEGATVELPLREYAETARRLGELQRDQGQRVAPRVVLGSASYEGEVTRGALSMTVTLDVTLEGSGLKVVPLIGDDVALLSAKAGGEPIGVTRRPGYHVWITDRTGAVSIELSALVAPRGPRGSIEHAFRAARTPGTELRIRMPGERLEPRFDGAVRNEVRPIADGAEVIATLEPTTEIRMVGFRDLGDGSDRRAKVYAEAVSLLSIDEAAVELFTVVRYNILYGATSAFEIELPEGLDVVSVEGEGALRHAVEARGAAAVLRGETESPIQGGYELSLRLRRKGPRDLFDLRLPRCLGVEREHGWLGVEVPGKLRLEEAARRDLAGIDARQLPGEVASSAVSPILKAYRYHKPSPELRLSIERLPEQDLATAMLDRVEARSVLSPEGRLLTELRVTLRNLLRPSLALALPEATRVRSALLDGEPVKPTRDERGRLLLPLKRSRGEERLEPFALEIVLESERPPLGLAGAPKLDLPAMDLPAASLRWTLHLPASNWYGDVSAAVLGQALAGTASWHKPAHVRRAVRWDEQGDEGSPAAAPGAAPIRIELPEAGTELAYERYWVPANEAVQIELPYVRAWILLPLKLLLAALLVLGTGLALRRARPARLARAVIARLRLAPARIGAWIRRRGWSRRTLGRKLALAAAFAVTSWLLIERAARIAVALVG
jgi:hypothetical protein